MSTSGAGGGPGPGPGGTFKSVQAPVRAGTVVGALVASAAAIYVLWEIRVRGSRKLGHIPKSVEKEWQDAQQERLRREPFESNPNKFAYMNPFSHNIPPSKAVYTE